MRVAESMVILFPMSQVGCARACSGVTRGRSSTGVPRRLPPEAVRMTRSISGAARFLVRQNTALCSLSTGIISVPVAASPFFTRSPAMTRVSLFARASRFAAPSDARVGLSPAAPTMADTSTSTLRRASSIVPSSPSRNSTEGNFFRRSRYSGAASASADPTATTAGSNSRICFSSRAMLPPQARPWTRNSSLRKRSTRSVDSPIEPVDPSMDIDLPIRLNYIRRPPSGPGNSKRADRRISGRRRRPTCRHGPG